MGIKPPGMQISPWKSCGIILGTESFAVGNSYSKNPIFSADLGINSQKNPIFGADFRVNSLLIFLVFNSGSTGNSPPAICPEIPGQFDNQASGRLDKHTAR